MYFYVLLIGVICLFVYELNKPNMSVSNVTLQMHWYACFTNLGQSQASC